MRRPGPIALAVLLALASLSGCAATKALKQADALAAKAVALKEAGDPKAALEPAGQALELREQHLGPEEAAVADSLNQVANLLELTGELDTAAVMLERCLVIRREQLGPDHPDVGRALNDLGNVRYRQGKYDLAEQRYREALEIREATLGPDHRAVSDSLDDLGWLLKTVGRYDEARTAHQRALAIRRAALGPDHPDTAQVMANLGDLYFRTGDFARSRALQFEALGIREAALGPDHLRVAVSLNNIGELERETGDLVAARRAYERALAIKERALGPDHPSVAITLNNLGLVLATIGDAPGARLLWERALAIREKSLGPKHPRVAYSLNNLGRLLTLSGDPKTARLLLTRAVRILAEALGPDHIMVAHLQNNLGLALAALGDLAAARERFERAQAIWTKALGPDHPDVARPLTNLGHMHRTAGFPEQAVVALGRALALIERALGPDHPAVIPILRELALAHALTGDRAAARDDIARALRVTQERVLPLLDAAGQRHRIALVVAHRASLDTYLRLMDKPADNAAAYAAVLRWKGAALRSLQRVGPVSGGTDAQAQAELARVRSELSDLVFGTGGELRGQARTDRIRALSARKETLQRETAGAHPRAATPAALCERLAPDQALVDLFRLGDPDAPNTARYLAFGLLGGDCAEPFRIDLGPAAPLEREVLAWRRLVTGRASMARIERVGRRLRVSIWDPVAAELGDRRRVWIVPDGRLSHLPFGALPDEHGQPLITRYTLARLPSAEALLTPGHPGGPLADALVVGDVDYGRAETDPAVQGGAFAQAPKRESGLFPVPRLPGSAAEVRAVAAMVGLKAGPLTGAAASESAIKRASPGRRLIHLATHGFFAGGKLRSALARTGGARSADELAGYHPLLLSGVVLAGANADNLAAGGEDGVLTAEELAGLDLSAAELVVLSGCDTGLGEVVAGEGVLGLGRALAAAGARQLVISLWKVPDQETGALMASFYRHLIQDDGGRARSGAALDAASALRAAQLDRIAEQQERSGQAHPLGWAGWVVSGAPGAVGAQDD